MLRSKRWLLVVAAVWIATLVLESCAAQKPPSLPIPPESPFSKIGLGMTLNHVTDLIGQPTDREIAPTGKAFAPFYFGTDRVRMTAYYRCSGRIIFGGLGTQQVLEIEYDPTEDGYAGDSVIRDTASCVPTPTPTIPSESPFSRIRLGMSYMQVVQRIGPPTGNQFIPASEGLVFRVAHYAGIGRIVFESLGTEAVSAIEYDPTEDGYAVRQKGR